MSAAANKEIVRRFFEEAWNQNKVAELGRGTVNLADFEVEFGNNLASEPANWILKLRLDYELMT